jgi:tRNA(adenine34) deaminase
VSIRGNEGAQVPNDLDLRMMARCIELSRDSIAAGELPFGCVISHDEEVVTEATNRVVRDGDVTRHAEMVATSEAQRVLGTKRLSRCTLYTNYRIRRSLTPSRKFSAASPRSLAQ